MNDCAGSDGARDAELESELLRLKKMGFSQEQWRAMLKVLSLAKELDDSTTQVIIERVESRFERVRERVREHSRPKDMA